MTDTTILRLTGIGIPPYSARGARESLMPIGQSSQVRRTINGGLVDVSAPQFRKYQSTITCNDQQPPAFANMWPGRVLTVDCISELSYEDTTDGAAERTIVPGSERFEDGFVFYRPRLSMMAEDFVINTDEYGAAVGWSLVLIEV